MSDFALVAPPPARGAFSRGWVCKFGSVMIRRRLKFDYTGTKGSGCRLSPDHPPWLVTGLPVKDKPQSWFWSLEEAMTWAQGEISLRTIREI